MGVFEINKTLDNFVSNEDIICILSNIISDKKLHCEWPKKLEETKDIIKIKLEIIDYKP